MFANMLKTTVLLAALTGLFLVIGRALGGQTGMVIAFLFAVVMNMGAYWFSGKIALKMAGAREVTYAEAPWLHDLVERLATNARLPKPKVAIIDSDVPNAFATGRNPQHAVVAVTSGLTRILDRDELAGVIAHELGHIRNRDILVMSIAATIAGAVTMIASIAQWSLMFAGLGGHSDSEEDHGWAGLVGSLFLIILAPIAATIIQLAISRAREYGADAAGADINGDPEALARALEKLERSAASGHAPAMNPATAHLYIVNPLRGGAIAGLFATHPPIPERVRRLRSQRGRSAGAASGGQDLAG